MIKTFSFTKHDIHHTNESRTSIFVVNKASERIYIQSAFSIPDEEKRPQETFSLTHTRDHFRKIVVTGDPYEKPWMNKEGITFIGIMPFLLDPKSIETL